MARAYINSRMLTWARERASLSCAYIAEKMKKPIEIVEQWEDGTHPISFSEAQRYADLVHAPFGMLYLDQPVKEKLPIPDRRTVGSHDTDVSLELKDTLDDVMIKMDWYKDYARENDLLPVTLIGKYSLDSSVDEIVSDIRQFIKVPVPPKVSKWEEYLSVLIKEIERNGILVMKNGVVKNNTHRQISVKDFRGFCIADKISPIIFINNNDAQSAQLFTLIHELTHLLLGDSGVSNISHNAHRQEEIICNAVAAEYLTPKETFISKWTESDNWIDNVQPLVKLFKVSRWVVARRALTLNLIDEGEYSSYVNSINDKQNTSPGGSYYRAQKGRVSETFARAVVTQALEGRMLLREAQRLTGIRPGKLMEFAKKELGL